MIMKETSIYSFLVERETKMERSRLHRFQEIRAPKIIITGVQKTLDVLESGKLPKVSGETDLLNQKYTVKSNATADIRKAISRNQ